MLPQPAAQPHLDRVWMVAHWKWELDPATPWWQKLFFKCAFRPFIHFSWNVMRIPCPKGVEVKGKKVQAFWFENGGFFGSEDQADLACVSPWDGYKDVPFERAFPPESAQYSSLVFPRQSNPRQHRKQPTFQLVTTRRETLKQLADRMNWLEEEIKKLRQALNR